MLFGPQRGSFFTVFDRFAETFGLPIAVVAIALIFGNMQALLENSFILAVTLIAPARRLFSYFFTYYSVDEEKFHVRSGLLNKKNLEIPLDSITSVDFTQNIIFQWADVYGVRVDNASSYGGNGTGKVSLALKRQEAERLKAILLSKSRGGKRSEEKRGEAVRVPVANIIAMGALQTKGSGLAQIISVITVVYGIVSIAFERGLGIEDELTGLIADMPGIWTACAAAAAFFVISAVLGAFFAVIKYYGFTIRDGGSSVLTEYGLFTKKTLFSDEGKDIRSGVCPVHVNASREKRISECYGCGIRRYGKHGKGHDVSINRRGGVGGPSRHPTYRQQPSAKKATGL